MKNQFLIIFIVTIIIGTMVGCGAEEPTPEISAEETTGQNAAEDELTINTQLLQYLNITYAQFREQIGTEAEFYHGLYFQAPITGENTDVVFQGIYDEEVAGSVLSDDHKSFRIETSLNNIINGITNEMTQEMTVAEFMEMLYLHAEFAFDMHPDIQEGLTAYYVAYHYVEANIDSNGDGILDIQLNIALDESDYISPDASTWIYENDLRENDSSDHAAEDSKGTEANASSWYGSYIIKDYILRGVTAIGDDEAEGLMWALVEYSPDEFNSDGILLEAPAYKETLRSRDEFAAMYSGSGGGYTFEAFGIEGDSLLEVTIDNSFELGNTFYVCDENRILIHYPGGAFLIAERGQRPDIVLSDEHKSFLHAMCYYMPAFVGVSERENEDFWREFIFYSFTSVPMDEDGNYKPIYGEGERVTVYREDLGYEEGEFKISEQYVQEYARLVFGAGMEMPEFKPAFEDMEEGQTALYYQDGYYYIGESDFDETEYRFRDVEVSIERYVTFAHVYYDILMMNDNGEQEVVGTVEFHLDYADNANGFRIVSKEVEYMQ